MVSQKKVKELKGGINTKDNLEYLQSLTADFFADRKNEELLDAWNHLQKTPGKTRIFTFATKRCPGLIAKYLDEHYPFNRHLNENGEYVWDNRPEKPYYAYIKHDKDTRDDTVDKLYSDPESGIHYHFYLEYQNARTFASVATELGIPVTMLQGVKVSKKAVLQYLTHENDPKKHHYSLSDIHANFCVETAREQGDFDHIQLAHDVWDMLDGIITREHFLQKYNNHCATLNFNQSMRLFIDVYWASQGEPTYKRHGRGHL